ncbi:MAG: FAD-dependent thymidylate synthase [Coriobacteriia bacterium]|nr:FAD-dependent thymidylate synthase [Coriobacteriia bacterium]
MPMQESALRAISATGAAPDWDSYVIETVNVPFSSTPTVRATFSDPMLAGYEVLVVADSLPVSCADAYDHGTYDGVGLDPMRLVTLVCRFPRCVLAEVNTHRVFSRNSASSRARAVKATIGAVMEDPYIPLFTMNAKGMGGGFATPGVRRRAVEQWLAARDSAVMSELRLLMGDLLPEGACAQDYRELLDRYYEESYQAENPDPRAISVHKQNANRLIEPFMWHEAIITSCYWENFLRLRISEGAQPEIHALAVLVREALRASRPVARWAHASFVDDMPAADAGEEEVMGAMMDSAAECARVSYKDRSKQSVRHGSDLGDRLLADGHLSPFEHAAFDAAAVRADGDANVAWLAERVAGKDNLSGNLSDAWVQLRRVLE